MRGSKVMESYKALHIREQSTNVSQKSTFLIKHILKLIDELIYKIVKFLGWGNLRIIQDKI